MKLLQSTPYLIKLSSLFAFSIFSTISIEHFSLSAEISSLHSPFGFYDNANGSPIIDLIDQAKSTLDMEIYEMDDPKVIASIRNAIKRGVVIHIVKEPNPVGGTCKVFETQNMSTSSKLPGTITREIHENRNSSAASCKNQQQLVYEVNNAAGQYVPFAKPDLCGGNGTKNCLEHGKIAIVDSKLALISTGNFNTTNLCDLDYSLTTCNRDYSYVTDETSITKTLKNIVEKDILGQNYDVTSIVGPQVSDQLTVGPNSLNPILSFIQTAKKRIQIENQYLIDPTMNAVLIAMAKKGIRVQVVIASACSFGKPKEAEVKRLTQIFTDF
jgi:phosphatidylserine/phosphatidylglycerophosphate/cardiolipin synthase-like enzyme